MLSRVPPREADRRMWRIRRPGKTDRVFTGPRLRLASIRRASVRDHQLLMPGSYCGDDESGPPAARAKKDDRCGGERRKCKLPRVWV